MSEKFKFVIAFVVFCAILFLVEVGRFVILRPTPEPQKSAGGWGGWGKGGAAGIGSTTQP